MLHLAVRHHPLFFELSVVDTLPLFQASPLNSLPSISPSHLLQYLLGHQDQEARNIWSTCLPLLSTAAPVCDTSTNIEPHLEPCSHQLCATLLTERNLLKPYSDQTGKFHTPSSRGNHYIFVLYHTDTNSIHTVAIPNRLAGTIRDAWEATHKMLIHQGHPPELYVLDNECSDDLKKAFLKYNVQFQRVPPKEHRVNAAERAIRTFKNHLIANLCTIDSHFPLADWDRLLPQTTLTLNLLRPSHIHPSLSAHASLFGQFDFNHTPIAPVGTKIVAHVNAESRTSFGEHGQVGWYIGPFPSTLPMLEMLFSRHHERT
jgi:hypothetical protein